MFESLFGSIKQGFSTLLPHEFCVPCFFRGLAEGIGLGVLTIGVLAAVATFAAPIAGAVALVLAIVGIAGLAYMAANWKHMDDRQKSEALGGLVGGALAGGIRGGTKVTIPSLAPLIHPGGTLAMGMVAIEVAVSPIAANVVAAGIGGGGAAMIAGSGSGDGTSTEKEIAPNREIKIGEKQLQKKFEKHAKAFGVDESYNKQAAQKFKSAIEKHVADSNTQEIYGAYRKEPVTHYYNPKTKLIVIKDQQGNFISGWKLNPLQEQHLLATGSLGGG